MGANAQTTVPTFTAGQVLTADQQNQSARTGVPVFAGTTERDAAFGGTGEKTLAEGQLCYLESTNVVQYYDGAAWATLGPTSSGLTLISSTTIGTGVSSHAVSNVFSATYDAYKIIVTGGLSSAANTDIGLQLGATTTGYYMYAVRVTSAAAFAGTALNSTSSFTRAGNGDPDGLNMTVDVLSPFLSKQTQYFGPYIIGTTSESMGMGMGWLDNTTSYTGFTLVFSGGTATGGTCRVYGYANS